MAKQRRPESDIVPDGDFLPPAVEVPTQADAGREALLAENARLREKVAALEAQAAPPADVPPPVGDPSLPLWRVFCATPTPLAHPALEVRAGDAHQAKLEFCRANSISDSVHPWKIERVAEGVTQ